MKKIFDISILNTSEDIENQLKILEKEYKNTDQFQLKGSNLIINKKYLMLNLYLLYMIHKYQLPIKEEFLLLGKVDNDIIHDIFTNIYEHLIDIHETLDDIEFYNKIYKSIKYDFWYCFNWLNNFCIRFCKAHIHSMDILNVSKTYHHKEIQDILKEEVKEEDGVRHNEDKNYQIRSKLMSKLKELDIPENQFKDVLDLGLANEGQLAHMLHMIGYRTDVDDSTISKLIKGNYIDGVNENLDMILESLADRKSRLYNKLLMPHCQYNNRQNQLAIYDIANIYSGDCQSNKLVYLYVDEVNYSNLEGKYVFKKKIDPVVLKRLKKQGLKLKVSKRYPRYVILTKEVLPYFIDTFIYFRSPTTCIYRDGVCAVCGGKLIERYTQREFNLGHTVMTEFFNKTAQKVLSNKHFQLTTSKEYVLPQELSNILVKKSKKIYFHSHINMKGLEIGFNIKDARALLNINNKDILQEENIFQSNFGRYRSIIFRKKDKNGNYQYVTENINLRFINKYPQLSKKFIYYAIEHFKDFISDHDTLWIPLDDFNKNHPIFETPVINYSIRVFYDRIDKFISKKITKFNNISLVLQEFSNIIYERSKINIVYLEIIIKSFLIKNNLDMSIVTSDIQDKTVFGNLRNIIKHRHIGTAMAYQEHLQIFRNPLFYLIPKTISPFDVFLNINIDKEPE